MTTTVDKTAMTKAGLFAAALGVLWVVMAWTFNPTTFHLGALVVAAVLPYGYVSIAGRASLPRQVLIMAAGGIGGALVITAVLFGAGKLQGPSLLPFGGAAMEAVVFALVGGGLSLLAAARPARA